MATYRRGKDSQKKRVKRLLDRLEKLTKKLPAKRRKALGEHLAEADNVQKHLKK